MPLAECAARVGHREYLLWQAWLDRQWDEPDRTDHYLMQVALAVRQANAAKPRQLRLDQFRLRFRGRGQARPPVSREVAAAMSRARWAARLGKPLTEGRGDGHD